MILKEIFTLGVRQSDIIVSCLILLLYSAFLGFDCSSLRVSVCKSALYAKQRYSRDVKLPRGLYSYLAIWNSSVIVVLFRQRVSNQK